MPQLHLSVDSATAHELERLAMARGMSLSRYLAQLVTSHLKDEWPPGYLDAVIGSCAESPLAEPADLELDDTEL